MRRTEAAETRGDLATRARARTHHTHTQAHKHTSKERTLVPQAAAEDEEGHQQGCRDARNRAGSKLEAIKLAGRAGAKKQGDAAPKCARHAIQDVFKKSAL